MGFLKKKKKKKDGGSSAMPAPTGSIFINPARPSIFVWEIQVIRQSVLQWKKCETGRLYRLIPNYMISCTVIYQSIKLEINIWWPQDY